MSWKDLLLENKLIITTGDGTVYEPLWKGATKAGEFNSTKYNFIKLKGTFVFRGKKPGVEIPLKLFFVGADCIDTANAFEISLEDERAILVDHPYYGLKTVQPISIARDDTRLNVSFIELSVFETITSSEPAQVLSIADTIDIQLAATFETIATSFASKATLNSSTISLMNGSTGIVDSEFKKIISVSSEAAKFKSLVGQALRAGDNVLTDARAAIDSINNLLNYPAEITDTVRSRVKTFKASLQRLKATVEGYTTLQALEYYTSFGSSLVNSTCNAVINPGRDDYTTRSTIIDQINEITEIFEDYIATIDAKTNDDAGIKGAFAPDANTINSVYSTYVLTLANLIELIQGAKIERTLIVSTDTNLVVLAYEIYGLEQDDSTIKTLESTNAIRRDKMIQIKKGTPIKYIK